MTANPHFLLAALLDTVPGSLHTTELERLVDSPDGAILAAWRDSVLTPSGSTAGLGTVVHTAPVDHGVDLDLALCYSSNDQEWSVILEVGVSLDSETLVALSTQPNKGCDGRILTTGSTAVLTEALGGEFVGVCGIAYSTPNTIILGDRTCRIEAASSEGARVFCVGAVAQQREIRFRYGDTWTELIDLT